MKPGQKTLSLETASKMVAAEFIEDWLQRMFILYMSIMLRKNHFRIKCLVALADITVDYILESIDFFMTDRAGDNATLQESLDVDCQKIIKCSTHVIFGLDHALDKVFRNMEQKIGIHKLLHLLAGEKAFSSPCTSIHMLGQIAIFMLLSPNHAASSVSLSTMSTNNG